MAIASRANSEYGQFMDQVKDMSLFPLWERVGGLKPGTQCVPAHWSYDNVRPQLDAFMEDHKRHFRLNVFDAIRAVTLVGAIVIVCWLLWELLMPVAV